MIGYAGSGKGAATHPRTNNQWMQGNNNKGSLDKTIHNFKSELIKPKDLIGVPWMLAFALRASGWYLRMDIIWNKTNPMPESVTDRPTKAHEYIFLLTKSAKYFYDAEAIKTESIEPYDDRGSSGNKKCKPTQLINGIRNSGVYTKANKRSVWTVSTQPFSGAHFATFPEDLIEPCILAGTSAEGCCLVCGKPYEREIEKRYVKHENWFGDKHKVRNSRGKSGNAYNELIATETKRWKPTCECNSTTVPAIVLDPFSGAATTAVVAKKNGRDYIGIELNEKYIELSNKRLYEELGMFI